MANNETLVIETHRLTKSFGSVHALRGIDLKVPKNSIFGFLGPNGSGKTTTMKILLGLARPSAGGGTIFGKDIEKESVAIRQRIGYLPQQPRFIEHMTARQNLSFTARFFFRGPDKQIQERCEEMLELVGLTDKADRAIKGFSGGEKQRLGIALAQVNQPELLILDEPASALDPIGRQAVLDIMAQLKENTTIFYSTHILDDVQRVSDSVAILNQGQIVASGPIDLILNGRDGVVYSLQVKGMVNGLNERLLSLPFVTNVIASPQNGSQRFEISIDDERAAEESLLRNVISDPRIIVTAFSRKRYELEEVFMEIVKGSQDDR